MVIAGIVFGAPLVLLAGLAAGIPLALHLLSRAQAVRIDFSAVRFIRAATMRTARRRRIENVGLLLLRMAVFSLLPLALALPFYRPSQMGSASTGDVAVGIVLDASGSMRQRVGTETVFDRGKVWAVRLIRGQGEVGPPGTVALTTVAGTLSDTMVTTSDLTEAAERVRRLQATASEGRLRAAVVRAAKSLAELPAANKVIYVLTDFQRATFDPIRPDDLGGIPVVMVELGSPGENNIGIEQIRIVGPAIRGRDVMLRASVAGRLTTPTSVPVRAVSADGTTIAQTTVHLDRGRVAGQRIELRLPGDGSAWFRGRVELAIDDRVIEDNRWYLAFPWAEPIGVLVVTDRYEPSARGGSGSGHDNWQDDPGFFVFAALKAAGWLDVRRMGVSELSTADLDRLHALYLAGVRNPGDRVTAAVTAFLKRRGRSVTVFMPADRPGRGYRSLLQQLGLARGYEPVRSGEALHVNQVYDSDALLQRMGFTGRQYGQVAVTAYCKVAPFETATVLMALANGDPLWIKAGGGESTAYLFATTPSTETGSLAFTPVFPTVVSEIATHAAAAAALTMYRAGEPFALGQAGRLVDQTGTVVVESVQEGGQIVRDQAGLYELKDESDRSIRPVAVNGSQQAIELDRVTGKALTDLAGSQVYYASDPDRDLDPILAELVQGRPMWDALLMVVVIVMLGETLLANIHTPTDPRHSGRKDDG